MGKPKKPSSIDMHPHEILRQNLKKSNKIVTKDGIIKKKIAKQFTLYQCSFCNKKFTDKWNMLSHEKIHLDEEYPCTKCEYVGKTKKYLSRHVRSKHSVPRLECHICGGRFHHPSSLKEHSMVHTGEKPLKCEVCGKGFRVSYSLNSHMLIHRNEKPYKCSFCEYACRDSSTLRKHEHRHMGITKMFNCKICPKKFDSKPKLKYHISEVHLDYLELDLKKHRCEHCGKAFRYKGHMRKHVQVIHTPAPCRCPICKKQVKHEVYLRQHMRSHFPQRPHVCAHEGCNKAFKNKGDLKKHAVIHARHLHAACSVCGATFARSYRLVAHMRTHEPREKSVVCDYCSVHFYSKNYLIKHIKQKHAEDRKRFKCDHCSLVTFNKPSIVMHLKYGQCRNKNLRCKICKTKYKRIETLRNHYLRTHKMRYKPMTRQSKKDKKPMIEIKVEPIDDPYEDVKLSMLEVSKEEVEIEEEGNAENDLVSYSNSVLSEDLQEYLLKEDSQDKSPDGFDAFLLKHVFNKHVKVEEPKMKVDITDEEQAALVTQKIKEVIEKAKEDEARKIIEKKKKKEAKLLEKKLRSEAKMMRRKRRRERFELERVRQMYNERIKKAVTDATKKEPAKKITYFHKKTSKEEVIETNESNKDSAVQSDSLTEHDRNKYLETNAAKDNDICESTNMENSNSEKDIDCTNKSIDVSNNINEISGDNEDRQNHSGIDVENESTNNLISTDDININIKDKDTGNSDNNVHDNSDKQNVTIAKHNDEKDSENDNGELTNDNNNCANDKDECINDENKATNEGYSVTTRNNSSISNDVDSNVKNDDNPNEDNSNSDSNYEPNSEDESTPSKKMTFKTHQCYVCFKLYPTKEELMSHCETHFEICNSTTLSKCPACGHVVSRNMAKHMRIKHDMHITIPHFNITRREDEQGSKYCYKLADAEVEIIPSVKILNHTAAIAIDKRKREKRDKTVAKTRLVKKGTEWIVESYAAEVSFQEMPEFTEQELSKLPVSDGYVDRLGKLSHLARTKGVRVVFPCDKCDKICQNFSALKLHARRHDPNKKPFAPRQNRRDAVPTDVTPKVKNTENRQAKPQPIKNKHKCDKELIKFYETHIRGADIEFWQFLKIYNKMVRDDVNDFKDLENEPDFGMRIYGESSEEEKSDEAKTQMGGDTNLKNKSKCIKGKNSHLQLEKVESPNLANFKSKTPRKFTQPAVYKISSKFAEQSVGKIRKIPSKLGQQIKPVYKRVIMISRKQQLEREKAKMLLREKIKANM